MVGTEIENGRLSIQVKDEGIGIDEVDLNRIFDRFWRSSHTEVRHRKGTGLGLYIAKVIAEAHNGTISACANSPDPGMTFVFNIPIHQV